MALGLSFNIFARDNASGALNNVGEAAGRTGGALKGIGKAAAVGLAGATVAAGVFGNDAVNAFAAVEDATGAAGVQFGKALPQITAFADKAFSSFGLSQRAALEAANTFGTLGKAAGLQGAPLAKFSTDFAGLAGDLASFKGTSTEQAIEAVGAALRGEAEPIRAYGVLLDDASLRQEALRQGLIKTTKDALTPQQKVLATQALLYKQTADAQGDFARTSDSTANTQKRLQAATENARVALGQKLAPAFTAVRTAALKVIQFLPKVIDTVTQVTRALFKGDFKGDGPFSEDSGFIDKVFDVREALLRMAEFVRTKVIPAIRQMGAFFAEEVVPRVQRFVTVFKSDVLPVLIRVGTFLKDQFIARFKTLVDTLKTSVIPAVQGLIVRIKENKELFITIGKVIGGFIAVVVIVGTKITQVLLPVLGRIIQVGLAVIGKVIGIVAAFSRFVAKLIEVGKAIGTFIVGAVQKMIDFPGKVITAVGDFGGLLYRKGREWFGKLKTAIVDAVATYVTFAVSIPGRVITAIGNFGGRLYAKGKEWWGRLGTATREVVGAVVSFVGGLPGKIFGAIGDLGSRLYSKGKEWFGKLGQAEREGVENIVSFLSSLPGKILGAIGDLGSLLYQKGKDLIQGLINGIKDAATSLPGAVKDAVTFDIPGVNIPGFARAGGFTPAGPSAPTLPAAPTFNTSTSGFSGNSRAESLLAEQNRLMSAQLTALLELAGTPRAAASSARTRLAGVSR